ncbi:male sterility protein-domain-containing protein [Lentinula edodes]|nr:male sterility protein-domain-containing protein [Lentinula edodes]
MDLTQRIKITVARLGLESLDMLTGLLHGLECTLNNKLFGGGPLNKKAGDLLSSKGVSIFVLYGSTETGIVSSLIPASPISDWEYFPLSGVVTAHMMPHGENRFELIVVSNDFCKPSAINTKIDGIDAYATSDLLLPHPTMSGYWRVFGRVDDQIIHNTGEKTNPVPLENTLNQDPHVAAAVMFGRGRFQAGILVEPKPPYKFEPSDETKLSEFRNKLWPTIEQMNNFAPQHSRVFKEMILVASPSKPFMYTAKNTARRQAILNQYEEEIEAVYKAVEETTQSDIPAPVEWNPLSTKSFVRNIVTQVLSHTVKDGDDIFQYGCDSLQATWIRNTIHRALRDSAEIDIRQSTSNFVYDHPTINQLAQHVLSVALGEEGTGDTFQENKVKTMEQMVKKYIADLPAAPSEVKQVSHHNQKVVLLTGSTGALGSHILDELVKYKGVKKIYALNRKGIDGLADRQRMALKERGLNEPVEDIECRRVVLLEGNTSISTFGLETEIFDEMASSVTHIIHNAWRVDFNPGLSSFESHIKGLRRIVDFCITSQASLFFTSSIGVLTGIVIFHTYCVSDINSLELAMPPEIAPPPEAPIPPEFALSNGYTQSKWVSEQILDAAHRNSGLKYLNIRVGQLTGAINGAWNVKEWFPSMIQASKTLGCIPSDHRNISWIPVYHAAATIVDFVNNGSIHDNQHVHLIHPWPVPWSSLASVFAKKLGLDIVEYRDWLDKLVDKGDTREMHLVPFFQRLGQGEVAENREAFEMPKVQLKSALAASETLREQSREIQEEDVERWLAYWGNV